MPDSNYIQSCIQIVLISSVSVLLMQAWIVCKTARQGKKFENNFFRNNALMHDIMDDQQ